jgi:hypothetical protein
MVAVPQSSRQLAPGHMPLESGWKLPGALKTATGRRVKLSLAAYCRML